MDQMERITATGIVPVVVLAKAEDAIPAARALLAGGIDIMEITMRTDAALESIRLIRESAPEMRVRWSTWSNAGPAQTLARPLLYRLASTRRSCAGALRRDCL